MAGRYQLDQTFLKYFQQMERKFKTFPLNLGGSAYGLGSPAGGFIGYLPQDRVSYDDDEIASSGIPASGISLIDNLNHIRYRLNIIESGGSSAGITFQEDDVVVASGVIIANFEGDVTVTDNGGNKVTINVTASGVGTDELVKVSANDTTSGYLVSKLVAGSGIVLEELNDGGNETLRVTASGVITNTFNDIYPITSPPTTGYTWYNQDDATVTVDTRKLTLYDPAHTGTDWHLYLRTLPSAPYKITCAFLPNILAEYTDGYWGGVGVAIKDSTGNLFINLRIYPTNDGYGVTTNISIDYYSDVNTIEGNYDSILTSYTSLLYLQVEDDSINRYYRYSVDGENFRLLHQHANNTYVTPNQIGFSIGGDRSNAWMTIVSYLEE